MFTIIKQKIFANKNSLIKIGIFLGLYLLFSDFAFANTAGGTNADKGIKEIGTKIVEVLTFANTVIALVLSLMTYFVTLFLSPEWTSGAFFGMTDKFKALWVFVSNFVYLIFAFILIFIAFMNIIGKQGYEFKTSIPKFVIGILMVPISWFFVNFMISLSSILFVGAMNLPMDTFPEYKSTLDKIDVKTNCSIDFKNLTSSSDSKSGDVGKNIYDCTGEEKKLGEVLNTGNSSNSIFGIMYTYVYGVLDITEYNKISKEKIDMSAIKTIGDVVVHIVFNLLFFLVYGLLMIALGLALMIRGIRLWIYMILSPLFGLMYFLGKDKDGFFSNFKVSEFIALAMVPVYTILALSFGLLFLWMVSTGMKEGTGSDLIKIQDKVDETVFTIEGFTLTIKGASVGVTNKAISDAFGGGLGIIGGLILKIFGIVILWGTVMAALRSSEITKVIVEPIAQFGDSVKNLAKNIPQYTPILPGGGTLSSLKQIPNSLDATLSNKSSRAGAEMAKKLGFTDDSIDALNDLSESIKNVKASNFTPDSKLKSYDELLKYIKNNPNDLNSERFKTLYTDFQKNIVKNDNFDIKSLGGTINLEKISRNLFNTVETNNPQKIFGSTYQTKAVNEAKFFEILSSGAIPPSAQLNNTATNIADSSVKTVDNKTVNGTDNNGQVNQGGNNGQNTQTPPTNGNGNP